MLYPENYQFDEIPAEVIERWTTQQRLEAFYDTEVLTPGYGAVFSDRFIDDDDEPLDIPTYQDGNHEPNIDAPASGWWEEMWMPSRIYGGDHARWVGFHTFNLRAIDFFL